jgi:hypothetical protein
MMGRRGDGGEQEDPEQRSTRCQYSFHFSSSNAFRLKQYFGE